MTTYGEDFTSDLDANLTMVGGIRGVMHAIRNRLRCRRGGDPDHQAYGMDVRSLVGSTVPDDVVAQQIQAQVEQDERVYSATVSLSRERLAAHSSERVKIAIAIVGDRGPFDFTLLVTDLTVDILDEA